MPVGKDFGVASADKLIARLEAGEALGGAEEGALEAQFEMASGFRITDDVLDEMQRILDGDTMTVKVTAYLIAFQGLGASILVDCDGVQSFLRAFSGQRAANKLTAGLRELARRQPMPRLSVTQRMIDGLRERLASGPVEDDVFSGCPPPCDDGSYKESL